MLSDIPYLYAGENKNIIVTITDSSGNVENIAGATFEWKLNVRGNPLIKSTSNGNISITNAANGEVTVYLQPIDTQSLEGIYQHELQMTDSQNNVSVVLVDKLNILPNLI